MVASWFRIICMALFLCLVGCAEENATSVEVDAGSVSGSDGLDGFVSSDVQSSPPDSYVGSGDTISDTSLADSVSEDAGITDGEDPPDTATDPDDTAVLDVDGSDLADTVTDIGEPDVITVQDTSDIQAQEDTGGADSNSGVGCEDASGQDCQQPICVETSVFPIVIEGDSSSGTAALQLSSNECADAPEAIWGIGSNDVVYEFTAPETNSYSATLQANGFDGVLYARSICDDGATTVGCADTPSTEVLELTLTQGETVYWVVDGRFNGTNASGPYVLTIAQGCLPQCEGKTCLQDDGCGALCGCPDGESCSDFGQCEAVGQGDTCDFPYEAQVGQVFGDTSTGTNNYSSPVCGAESALGGASKDNAWELSTLAGAQYTVTLSPEFDGALYAVTTCGTPSSGCLDAADDGASAGTDQIEFVGTGDTVFLIVDGYSNSFDYSGGYTMQIEECVVSCENKGCNEDNGCGAACGCTAGFCDPTSGECVDQLPANTCDAASEISTFGVPYFGDTTNASNDYSLDSCGGVSGKGGASNDQVWSFQAAPGATYTITLAPNGWDPVLYVIAANDCSDINSTCLDATDSGGTSGNETVTVTAPLDGGTIFVFVDGYSDFSNLYGDYSLTVSEPCVPDCSGQPCTATNGCGGTCGCASGESCEPITGECVDALAGSTCETAFTLDEFGVAVGGDTSLSTNDYNASTSCDGLTYGKGEASNEHVWTFETVPEATYVVTLNPDGWDPVLYVGVGSDCSSIDAICLGGKDSGGTGGAENITFTAPADGGTAWIFVDGYSNTSNLSGPYTLLVSEPCVPNCDGLECGSDGCGGSCGTCSSGICEQGTCAGPPPAECIPLEVISCGQTVLGLSQTTNSSNAFSGYTCQTYSFDDYSSSYEVTYIFEADFAGSFTVDGIDDGAMDVTVLKDTGNGCVDEGDNCIDNASSEVTIPVAEGDVFYIVWDSYSSFIQSSFGMSITCCSASCDGKECGSDGCGGTCGECGAGNLCDESSNTCVDVSLGNSCENPYETEPGTTVTGNTDLATNDYSISSCPSSLTGSKGGAGNDQVWTFEMDPGATYTVTLEPSGWDPALYILTDDCSQPSDTCVGLVDSGASSGTESITFTAPSSGGTAFVVVDGWSNFSNTAGDYSLTISAPCEPSCDDVSCASDNGCGAVCGCPDGGLCDVNSGECVDVSTGDTCDNPFIYDTFGQPVSGNTELSLPDYEATSACPGLFSSKGGASNDQVWLIDTVPNGIYTATLDPSGWDPVLYVFAGDTCEPGEFTCLGGDDGGASSGVEEVVFTSPAEGGPVYIMVDGYSGSSNLTGPYTLTVDAPCIPSCVGLQCTDDNGCGVPCGCVSGEVCNPDGSCVDASEGDTCDTPFEVTDLDTPLAGNTDLALADYGFNSCPGSTTSKGGGSNDQVWAYEVYAGNSYTVTLNPQGWDAALYVIVADDCSDIDGSCVGADDTGLSSGSETVSFNADNDGFMFIIVDGWSDFSNQSGPYTITVSEL